MDKVGIGIIGCGNISDAYLKAAAGFPLLDIRGVADIRPEAAVAAAARHGLLAQSVDALLRDDSVEIIVNLTIPAVHVEVGLQVLEAGKHVHSEKPLGLSVAQAGPLLEQAARRGLRVGCAPDTFLGGGHQSCRALVDQGVLGDVVAGTAFFMCPGHERWHPNPAFYYQAGGGPMLDMGPYYITALVNLIGPVARVSGITSRHRALRTITSEPRKGQSMEVTVDTHVAGTLEFASGAVVSIATSFDVPKHTCKPIELHGTQASLQVPDPNRFGGPVVLASLGQDWVDLPITHAYHDGNFRSIGVADMAHALRSGRPHRASGELAWHVLEVMEAFQRSSESGHHVAIASRPPRPAPLPAGLAGGALD
jgi:predicted dehydrogenase